MKSQPRIIITGAAGMLGSALLDYFRSTYQVYATDLKIGYHPEGVTWTCGDLMDGSFVRSFIREISPVAVLHCAAIVNVDYCEKNPVIARNVHVESTKTIIEALQVAKSALVYISTDSVFDGRKKELYTEKDATHPLNVYAETKYAGETAALAYPNSLVLRTNIFGWSREEHLSFAEWVLKGLLQKQDLSMFTDVTYTPIHVTHLSEVIQKSLHHNLTGLFHATGSSNISKYDFGLAMAHYFEIEHSSIIPASVDKAGLSAQRPKNMALDNTKLSKTLSFTIPGAADGISLLKTQYDTGWVAAIKGRPTKSQYQFWEN